MLPRLASPTARLLAAGLALFAVAALDRPASAQSESAGTQSAPATQPSDDPQINVDVVEKGTGATAEKGDFVTVHYTGKLAKNDKVFDSSRKRDQAFTFRLGEGDVIQGWDRGVAGMQVGGRRKLVIPPELAYGEQGAGDAIPPNATLVFDVELLDVAPGLTIKTTKKGKPQGETAEFGEYVTVHYTGRLAESGKVFDSSRERGEPFTFPLGANRVVQGWELGVQGMKVGEKRTVTFGHPMGYGEEGRPPKIPGKATLQFDIELISTSPGVKPKTVEAGKGQPIDRDDMILAHFTLTADGERQLFDSRQRGEQGMPLMVGPRSQPPALWIGVIGMKSGETRRITSPPEWATYQGQPMAQNELTAEVELIRVLGRR